MKPARLSSVVLLAAPVLFAAFAPERWLYRQRIATTGSPATRVILDRAVHDGAAQSLADLRVVRDGLEIPYLLSVAHANRQTAMVPVRIVNKESRAGTLFVTLELDKREPHNQLELFVTREDFRSQLTIEASDDGRQWASVRQSAYIFRYHADDGGTREHTTLRYPDSRRRYVRLAIAGWPDPTQFSGAAVRFDTSAEARRSEIWTGTNIASTTRGRSTCTVVDTGTSTPRDRIDLTPANGPISFHRSLSLEHGPDGKSWYWLGTGAIYRIAGEESLTAAFPESRLRFLRACIFHGDDPPLGLSRIRLFGIDRVVSFRSETPGTYWLYYGAASAKAPEYDLARTVGDDFVAATVGSVSARESNPAYRPPPAPVKPWTERFPGVLYAVMGIAVVGLGWMALRLLLRP